MWGVFSYCGGIISTVEVIPNFLMASLHSNEYLPNAPKVSLHCTDSIPPKPCWTPSDVLTLSPAINSIPHDTEHPSQYWTSSIILNILHNTEHPSQYWTSPTKLKIPHNTEHPPRCWTPSTTALNTLHSTKHPPQYYSDIPKGDYFARDKSQSVGDIAIQKLVLIICIFSASPTSM